MTIIGCMTAYNEAEIIGPAIDSMFAIGCDRVIVVDGQWTGWAPDAPGPSTDGTRDVARKHGAEVIECPGRPWHDQPEARTASLVGKLGDWYVVVDADERCRGELPDLAGDVSCYKVFVDGPVTGTHISPTRLFRHTGRMMYHTRHNTVYAGGALIKPVLMADPYWLEHIDRNDPERQAIKDTFYPAQTLRERGGDAMHPRPILQRIPERPLGPVRYIGNGSWIPGIPASDMDAFESDLHNAGIVANLESANPIYELVNLPATTPAKSTPRRKTRKEQ